MNKYAYKAFTLVELIVVITILAILGTIGFISISSYSENARDAVRLSDTKAIKTSLELYRIDHSKYPATTNPVNITYSGATLWEQGTFGVDTNRILGKLNVIPKDPLLKNEYTYSVTSNNLEYQLGYALETGGLFSKSNNSLLLNKTYASSYNLRTGILGNYNGKALIASTGGIDYILAVPSIIASDTSSGEIMDILKNKNLSFNGYSNLPDSYKYKPTFDFFRFYFSEGRSLVFEGDINDLKTQDSRVDFFTKISDAYVYSDLEGKEGYKGFSAGYIDKFNPTFDYINISCLETEKLLNKDYGCLPGTDEVEDILKGDSFTGIILDNGDTNYYGQWLFGDSVSSNWGQSLGSASHARSSIGMDGGLNKSIGVKWKLFTGGKGADTYFGGMDINGDSKNNFLYGYGGKLFLGDPTTGGFIWQTKVLDIKKIFGVEDILGDGSKSIIVALGRDWYLGVINGKTGNLDRISSSASGPVKMVKVGWPRFDYKIFDINNDGVKEYHFKQRYHKYNSFKFYKSGGKVVGETLWSSEGYGDYNENTTDGYQVSDWSMGTLSSKLVVGTKGANTFSFYSNDVNSSLSGKDAFKMPAFGKLNVGSDYYHGRKSGIGYFYDLNGDGNDEYISRIDEELNNNKTSRIFVSGLSSTGAMVQYMSLANPFDTNEDPHTKYGNFSKPIALYNSSNPDDSYILSKGRDPADGENKWMMFKYTGLLSTGFKKNSAENESFNYDIVYDKFDDSYSVSGIFNNGTKDYIVLYKGGTFYFYEFKGVDTFLTESSLQIHGGFFGNTLFDGGYDIRREKNKNSGIFMSGFDTTGNGKNEFVVTDGGYFKFYEIDDSGVNKVRTFGPYNSSGVKKWGLTDDNKNLYKIDYNGGSNLINYYETDLDTDNPTNTAGFIKRSSDSFYAGGQVRDMEITRLGDYNKVMIKWLGMFDARDATPSTPPIKLSNDYRNSFDMDKDGHNEIFIGNKAYEYKPSGSYNTVKYNFTGWAGDIDGDGVDDRARSYCSGSTNFINNLYYTFRSGKTGSPIIPDLDYGDGNGWCDGGNKYSNVSEDFDGDGKDDFAIGTARLGTRLVSLSGSTASGFTIKQGDSVRLSSSYYLSAFDFDGDGFKEIINGHDLMHVYKGNVDGNHNPSLTHLFDVNPGVKSTWGVGLGLPSIYKKNDITYMAFRGNDGEVALMSRDGSTVKSLFKNYYLNTKIYKTSDDILNDNGIPLATADVLLGDFMGSGDVQVLVGGGDGYLYILGIDGSIIRAFDLGVSIKKMIIGDTNGDLLVDILVSTENGYIYQVGTSRIAPPSFVKDGFIKGRDSNNQYEKQKVGLSFAPVTGANGYFVSLYNYTSDTIVFDQIDVGNITSLCLVSSDYTDENCMDVGKNFNLTEGSVYQWRVQSYNDKISSPNALSNGFYINKSES